MDFLDKRISGICGELRRLSVKKRYPVTEWIYKKGNFVYPEDADRGEGEWEAFDTRTMHWYGPDEHYWFRTDYTVPEELDGKRMWLNVRSQIEEWDDGKNPQFLLYVNGEIVQGIDMNHKDVLLSECAKAGEVLRLDLQSYTGTLHSEFSLITEMQEVDAAITKLFYDLRVPRAAFSRMDKEDRNRIDIENILNNAINLLDLRTPYSDEFYASVKAADEYLDKALYSDMGHVGKQSIYFSWPFVKVCLILNYLGQGAWLIENAGNQALSSIEDLNPFFLMLPPP